MTRTLFKALAFAALLLVPPITRAQDADGFITKVDADSTALGDAVAGLTRTVGEIDKKLSAALECHEGWDPKYLGPAEVKCQKAYEEAQGAIKKRLAASEAPDKRIETAKKNAFFKKAEASLKKYEATYKNAKSINAYKFKTDAILLAKTALLYKRLKECVEGGDGEAPGGQDIDLTKETTVYRTYGGKSGRIGPWFSENPPASAVEARSKYALLGGNHCKKVATVVLPKGTPVRRSEAASLYGERGGGIQIWVPVVDAKWWKSDASLKLR